jgi:Tol biopolymer transport system component
MNPDGSNQKKLTAAMDFARPMDWSPDDKWLVNTAGFGFDSQVYKIDALTGAVYQLSYTGFAVSNPVWRPDTWE